MLEKLSRLVGRLSVSRKLLLIYLLDLSAIIFITNILIDEKYIAINFARKEMVGNQYIAEVRGGLFAIAAVPGPAGRPPAAALGARLRDAEGRWGEGMKSGELNQRFLDALADLERHPSPASQGKALEAGRQLLSRIGDQSNLILDPDLDSYYAMSLSILRFPELVDLLLQLPTAPVAATGRINPDLLVLEGKLSALAEGIASDYAAAYAGNPGHSLAARLDNSRRALGEALEAVRLASREGASGGRLDTLGPLRAQALAATETAWLAVADALQDLIQARIEGLFLRMWQHLGTALALLLIILFLVFYVARQIARPLGDLARVAEQVSARNDYTLRASWASEDEIGKLVMGFNTMLERLDQERQLEQRLASQAAAAAAQHDLLEAIPLPMLVTSIPDHRVLHANGPVRLWIGEGEDNPWARGVPSRDRARFFQRLADEEAVDGFEVPWHGPGRDSWALLSARRLDYQGQPAVLTTFTPIDQQKKMEAGLQLWAKVFEATSEGIMVVDRDYRVVNVNAAFKRATGYHAEEVVGRPARLIYSEHHDGAFYQQLESTVRSKGAWQGEYWLRCKNGEAVPQWLTINTVRDEHGDVASVITVFTDIRERKAQEERIRHLAHHDGLTGLPNRLLFLERLQLSLDQARRQAKGVAVLFIDLDRFKTINDSLGHHVGDGLLQSVAQRLSQVIRAGDTVSRLGGDEFVVILNSIETVEEVAQIIEQRLIPLVRQPHAVAGSELYVSCSVGVALFPEDGEDLDQLMRNADAAMYEAKSTGRDNFQFFTQAMNARAFERLRTENALRHAVEREELELHFQPLLDIASRRLVGAEALLRWRHPELGLFPPARFIPVAEETGLIVPIGAWVLGEACRRQQEWQRAGLEGVFVAVNISAVQFRHGSFVDTVADAVAASGMEPACLELEVTETMLMESAEANVAVLKALKASGVRLSIDDFGTGYSSLNYLNRFPIDKLKVDRSFVADMLTDPTDLAITRAIIGLGHTLGLKVTAEGVEYPEELCRLAEAGCDEVQGYFFARPLPAHEFLAWAQAWEADRCRQSDNESEV